MNTKLVAFLSACAVVGALHADALTVTPYDFNSLLVSGSGAGDATMTINGAAATTTKLGDDALLATGLSAGNVYKYVVTLGGTTSGEVTMGNGTGKLFGADATATPDVSGGIWNTTAPYVAPTVTEGAYVLQGASNKFDVTSSPAGKIVYIDSTMTFTDGADELDENLTALGAFTLAQLDETSDACSWVGLTGGDPKWVTLTGVTAEPGTYVSRMEFDFNGTSAKVRYLVGPVDGNLTVLKNGDVEWFPVAASATSVSSVAFEGTGSYTKLEGSSINANVAEVGGTEYANIADALTQNTGATVTLLTNTRPEANDALVGGSWTINENGKTFRPYDVAGYTHTYEGTTFAVTKFTASMDLSIASKTLGYDYTNATLTVAIANADIQAGNPVAITATVKNASGTTVDTVVASNITGDGNVNFALTNPVDPKGEYTVEFEVTQQSDSTPVKTVTDSFIAATTANWFDARATRWSTDGTWKIGEETQTISTEKIALGGNQYDFTPNNEGVKKGFIRVDTVIEVDGAIDNDDLPTETNVQGMLTLAETSAESETPVWKAYVGGSWQALTGGATEPGTYTVRAEFDYAGTANKVRYSVAKGDADFTVLTLSGSEWLANGQPDVTTLAGASAMGMGNLVSMKGESIDAYVAEVNGAKYESLAAAFAAAGDNEVKILWNCTWIPTVGAWRIDRNGKSLLINAADGIFVSDVDGLLRVNDVAVAKIGTTEYGFLDVAFNDVAANATVEMLTNVVQNYDVVQAGTPATLDLAGHFVKIADGKTFAANALTITNSTETIGGFNGTFAADSSYTIAGGKWAANTDADRLMTDFEFAPLSPTETVDGVIYAYVAQVVQGYPMGGDEVKVIIPDADVAALVPGSSTMTKEQIATELKKTGANGYPIIQSYVLGLTPTVATSKPVVETAQIAATDSVKVSLVGVSVKTETGVTVQYQLETADNASFTDSAKSDAQTESTFTADVPATGSKVKYYKINILFSNPAK